MANPTSGQLSSQPGPIAARPDVTVLVPIYNVERHLDESMASLESQTLSDLDILCINDGSTDGSREIIERHMAADPRIRVLDKPNSGYGDSINQGIDMSEGRYLAILEPDDIMVPDALEKMVAAGDESSADIVKADYWFYWSADDRRASAGVVRPEAANRAFRPMDEPAIFLENPSIWSAIYRREFLIRSGVRCLPTPGASFQDLGFCFKAWACAERVWCLPEEVVLYRQDNEASSVNSPGKVFCVCDEFDSIMDFIAADPSREPLRPYAFRLRYDSYMWNFERLSSEMRRLFLDRMVADLKAGIEAGDFVESLFRGYQAKNLRLVIDDPERFWRSFPDNPTRSSKARYYLKTQGLRALLGMMSDLR